MKRTPRNEPTTRSSARSGRPSRRSAVASLGLLPIAALVAAGCGSSASSSAPSADRAAVSVNQPTTSDAPPPAGSQAPGRHPHRSAHPSSAPLATPARRGTRHTSGHATDGTGRTRSAAAASPASSAPRTSITITRGNPVQRPAAGTGASASSDGSPGAKATRADGGRPTTAGQPNPCDLVSVSQAQSFTGKSVTAKEAPLGPTCIYQMSGAKAPITVAVERQSFSAVKPHLKSLAPVAVGKHTAFCGVLGSAITYVPLPGGQLLNITAPCQVGTKFAAVALPRLGL